MADVYTPPHYLTLGALLTLRSPDGELHHIPVVFEEVGEAGIGALIGKMLEACASRGLAPPTVAEFNEWANAQAQARLQEYAMRALQSHRDAKIADHDEMLARHIARNPKGDA